ncbi:hypothetical protein [Moritella viscosa]|uniref:hypothetical protein n=1 Tax=Moritella viscosa TaxID=80854 RepID=UPI000923180D|nr:hypothetical protein [Moritella viscosa]SGZ15683.1 Putative uncharacterized protein [Moritella viscosa]SHO14427.1 Putative uncharacterized protein [Moritella viscosa]
MKKLLTLIFITFSFYAYANAPAEDLKIGDCVVTDYKDLDLTTKETKDCIYELNEKGTVQQQKNNSIAVSIPDAARSFISSSKTIIGLLITCFVIFGFHKAMDYKSSNHKFKDFLTQKSMKIAVVSFLTLIVSNSEDADYALEKSLDYLNVTMFTVLDTTNRINSQSESINNIAIQESNSKFTNKVSEISNSIYLSQFCSMQYKQEIISKYNERDSDLITNDPDLDCIEDTYTKVFPQSLAARANMLPLAFAINYCSNKNDSVSVNCGKVNSRSKNKSVEDIINKHSIKLTELANEYRDIICKQSLKIDKERFEGFCRNYSNGSFSESSTDVLLSVYESKLRQAVTQFQSDLSRETVRFVKEKIEKDKKSNSNNDNLMLNASDQIKQFMSVNYDSGAYSSKIDSELNDIYFIKPSNKNLNSGSITTQNTNSRKIHNTADFYSYLASNSKLFFEINNSLLSDTFIDFAWLTDTKTMLGSYSDAKNKKGFKVDVNTFRAVDKNRISLFTLGSGAKIVATVGQSQSESKNTGIFPLLNTFGSVSIALSFYPEISSNIVIAYIVVIYLKLILIAVIVLVFKIVFTVFVNTEVDTLFDEMINVSFAIMIIPASLLCAMLASSGIAAIGINVIEFIGIMDNVSKAALLMNLTAIIFLIILSAITFFKMFFETHNFLEEWLKTDSDKITGKTDKIKKLAKTATQK